MEEENQLLEGAKTVGKGALWGIGKYGEAIDWSNDQVNLRNTLGIGKGVTDRIPGQWDEKILDYSYKDLRDHTAGGIGNVAGFVSGGNETVNAAGELLGQVLLPDAVDFIGGVGYADNLARIPKALKQLDIKAYEKVIDGALTAPRRLKDWGKRPIETIQTALTGGLDVGTARDVSGVIPKGAGDAKGIRTASKFGDTNYWANLSEKNKKLFQKSGIDEDNAVFFLSNFDKPIGRELGAAIEGGAYSDRTFNFMKSELFPEIIKSLKGIDLTRTGNKLTVDHVAQIRATLPFYNGVPVKDFPKVRKILEDVGIYGGHNPKNLRGLPFDVHVIKSRFWIRQVGQDGSKFFAGRDLSTWKSLKEVAKEYSQLQTASTKLVDNLMEQIKITRTDINPEELMDALSKVELNPGDYNLKDFKEMSQEIITQIIAAGGKKGPKTKLSTYVDKSIKSQRRNKGKYYQPTLDPEGGTFIK